MLISNSELAELRETLTTLRADNAALRARLADVERERDEARAALKEIEATRSEEFADWYEELRDAVIDELGAPDDDDAEINICVAAVKRAAARLAEATPIIAAVASTSIEYDEDFGHMLWWQDDTSGDELLDKARAYQAKYGATDAEPTVAEVMTCTQCHKRVASTHDVTVQGALEHWCDDCYGQWGELVNEPPQATDAPVGHEYEFTTLADSVIAPKPIVLYPANGATDAEVQ